MGFLQFLWGQRVFRYAVVFNVLLNASLLIFNGDFLQKFQIEESSKIVKICGKATTFASPEHKKATLSAGELLLIGSLGPENLKKYIKPTSISKCLSQPPVVFASHQRSFVRYHKISLRPVRGPPIS